MWTSIHHSTLFCNVQQSSVSFGLLFDNSSPLSPCLPSLPALSACLICLPNLPVCPANLICLPISLFSLPPVEGAVLL
jgi:hypothetical protein